MDLSEIPTESLVHEVQRRLECLNKPEKRLILIGAWPPLQQGRRGMTCGPGKQGALARVQFMSGAP